MIACAEANITMSGLMHCETTRACNKYIATVCRTTFPFPLFFSLFSTFFFFCLPNTNGFGRLGFGNPSSLPSRALTDDGDTRAHGHERGQEEKKYINDNNDDDNDNAPGCVCPVMFEFY